MSNWNLKVIGIGLASVAMNGVMFYYGKKEIEEESRQMAKVISEGQERIREIDALLEMSKKSLKDGEENLARYGIKPMQSKGVNNSKDY